MDFMTKLRTARSANNSLLCVGLDPVLSKLPAHIASQPEPFFTFNKAIIDTTADLVCAYKPNSAFYEAAGPEGILQLQKTVEYINQNYPNVPVILDSKRADIGNTNDFYVTHTFDYLKADAVTVHPYLGREALAPFLARKDKGIIVLCRTSNPGAGEFQDLLVDGKPLYEHVAEAIATSWNVNGNCMLVVGATYPEEIKKVREIVGPDITFLIPGIGAQGGDLQKTIQASGENIIINSSRGIIYASEGGDFAETARGEALQLRDEINKCRQDF
jgi:orotidine-5'-phosphate decarboxylase